MDNLVGLYYGFWETSDLDFDIGMFAVKQSYLVPILLLKAVISKVLRVDLYLADVLKSLSIGTKESD